MLAGGHLLGLLSSEPDEWFQQGPGTESLAAEAIEARIEARATAKANKDYQRADDIRASLEAEGVVLEDGPDGTTWRRGV